MQRDGWGTARAGFAVLRGDDALGGRAASLHRLIGVVVTDRKRVSQRDYNLSFHIPLFLSTPPRFFFDGSVHITQCKEAHS